MPWFGLPLAIGLLTAIAPARAQSSCPHARLRLDTAQPVDAAAICDAAVPWAEQGIEVFVFLTDRSTASEDEWFALLDAVEAEAGILVPGQPDQGKKNVFAVLASTDASRPWGLNFSIGETLEATPLVDRLAEIEPIKTQVSNQFADAQYTEGTIVALDEVFALAYPGAAGEDFPWLPVIGFGLGSLAVVGGGGVGVMVIAGGRQLEQRLKQIQGNVANLLMACDQLLGDAHPSDSLLYQTFQLAGGERYPELVEAVTGWIDTCQRALVQAFNLNQQLLDTATQARRPLTKRLADWETLYVTLVGSSDRILSLSEADLHALLDPVGTFDSRTLQSSDLAAQLAQVQRDLASKPLKVELKSVDPQAVDREGVLGYIDQVKGQVVRLQAAQTAAPEQLAALREERAAVAAAIPADFWLSAEVMLSGIDRQLDDIKTKIEAQQSLRAIQQVECVRAALNLPLAFGELQATVSERQAQIDAIAARGYEPPTLASDRAEISADREAIQAAFRQGDYDAVQRHLEELDQDSTRALAAIEAWQALYERNLSRLDDLYAELSRLDTLAAQAHQAGAALAAYPESNSEVARAAIARLDASLQQVRTQHLPDASRLNSFAVQELLPAEQALLQAASQLEVAEAQAQLAIDCQAEVQALATELAQLLDKTERDWQALLALRDRDDSKITPEIDAAIETARQQLQTARDLATARELTRAAAVQRQAREAILTAAASAQKQVAELDQLLKKRQRARDDAEQACDRAQQQARQLSQVVLTLHLRELVQAAVDELARARRQEAARTLEDRVWIAALRAEIAAYEAAEQAAATALTKLRREQSDYDKALREAQRARERAEAAIASARRAIDAPDAAEAGQSSLRRAERLLPSRVAAEGMSLETLASLEREARTARSTARQAEQQAERRSAAARAARQPPVPPASSLPPPTRRSAARAAAARPAPARPESPAEKSTASRPSAVGKRRRL